MGIVITFPSREDLPSGSFLEKVRHRYYKNGLSQASADAAIEELTPLLSDLLGASNYEIRIPDGVTPEQSDAIEAEFARAIGLAHDKHAIAVMRLVDVVGSKYV